MGDELQPADGTTIEQPAIPADATWDDLPDELERRCCPGEIRNTTVYKALVPMLDKNSPTGASVAYTYKRGNDDTYRGSSTIAGLIDAMNDPEDWPVVGG
ncbi:hypothetical protein [Leifsonia sp. Leaf264]|uniref:hypothetical protein n=1 Tax=Leifsonia sp. Leaf264 TaxID=1736314 RepID=UPI0006F7A7D5|nr:hypothetical protein [Leifsonia sp. Leaf264]KQO98129.1 hypothetical protein ASF30_08580 [Leifsonia sp. Leaf264]